MMAIRLRKTTEHEPGGERVTAGQVGQADERLFGYWRRGNVALAGAAALAGLWLAWSLASGGPAISRADPAAPGVGPAVPDNSPEVADYAKRMATRKLFLMPNPPAPGPDVADALERAKARLVLRGVNTVGGRTGAYFEVREAARPGMPVAPMVPGVAPSGQRISMPKAGLVRRPARSGGMKLYFEGDRVGDFVIKKIDVPTQSVTLTLAGREVVFNW